MTPRKTPSRLTNGPIRGAGRRTVQGLASFFLFLIITAAVGTGVIQIQTHLYSIRGDISSLRKERDLLREKNRTLKRQVASLSSPSWIVPRAHKLGLVFPEAGSYRTVALAPAPGSTTTNKTTRLVVNSPEPEGWIAKTQKIINGYVSASTKYSSTP